MALKVVQGLIDRRAAEADAGNPKASNPQAVNPTVIAQSVQVSAVVSTEAAVSSVRSKPVSSGAKVREFKEARELTDKISSQVREQGAGLDAHDGLDPISAREHFSDRGA